MMELIQRRSNSSTSDLCILDSPFFFCQWWGNLHSNKNYLFVRQIWDAAKLLNNEYTQTLKHQYSCPESRAF